MTDLIFGDYSPHSLECPTCHYEGFMIYSCFRVFEMVKWDFFICKRCNRFVASTDGITAVRMFDVPFLPLNLRRPQK